MNTIHKRSCKDKKCKGCLSKHVITFMATPIGNLETLTVSRKAVTGSGGGGPANKKVTKKDKFECGNCVKFGKNRKESFKKSKKYQVSLIEGSKPDIKTASVTSSKSSYGGSAGSAKVPRDSPASMYSTVKVIGNKVKTKKHVENILVPRDYEGFIDIVRGVLQEEMRLNHTCCEITPQEESVNHYRWYKKITKNKQMPFLIQHLVLLLIYIVVCNFLSIIFGKDLVYWIALLSLSVGCSCLLKLSN